MQVVCDKILGTEECKRGEALHRCSGMYKVEYSSHSVEGVKKSKGSILGRWSKSGTAKKIERGRRKIKSKRFKLKRKNRGVRMWKKSRIF